MIPGGVLAVLVTAALAGLLGWAVFVPGLRRLPTSGMFILTAGLLTALEGIALVVWGSQSYTLPAFSGERPVALAGLLLPSQGFWVVGLTAAVTVLQGCCWRARGWGGRCGPAPRTRWRRA